MKIDCLSKEEWEHSWIIFDTSALCKMYDMTDSAKKTMMDILCFLKDRIWIPGHVLFEYNKNRAKVIFNPLDEQYAIPHCFNTTELKTLGRKFIEKLGEANNYHPFVSEDAYTTINNSLEIALRELARIKDTLTSEIKERKKEIESLISIDIIQQNISNLPHGNEYSYDQMIQICREGEFRYRNNIPPGYMDVKAEKGRKKLGFDIFGDLFIWKQILDYAQENLKDVIFICNDEKEDWWINFKEKELRMELYKEFLDFTNHKIYATSLEGFISELVKRYKDDTGLPFYAGLETVKDVLDYYSHFTSPNLSTDDVYVFLKCKHCNKNNRLSIKEDFDFDWIEDSWSELEMGPEYGYSSVSYLKCEHCGEEFTLKFRLTEYPAGRISDIDLDLDGCEILNEPNWMRAIMPTFDRECQVCLYCGRHVHDLTDDMCDECRYDFNQKIRND